MRTPFLLLTLLLFACGGGPVGISDEDEGKGEGEGSEQGFECLREHCEYIELGQQIKIRSPQMIGDSMVFSDGASDLKLYQMKLEPDAEPKLITDDLESFVVHGGQVYTCGSQRLIRWSLDGSHRSLASCTGLVAANSFAVYTSISELHSGPVSGIKRWQKIVEIRDDGSTQEIHFNLEESYKQLFASDSHVCWTDWWGANGCIDLRNDNAGGRNYDKIELRALDDTTLYYRDGDGFLMRRDLNPYGQATVVISNSEKWEQGSFIPDGPSIYLSSRASPWQRLSRMNRDTLQREPIANIPGLIVGQSGEWLLLNWPLALLRK